AFTHNQTRHSQSLFCNNAACGAVALSLERAAIAPRVGRLVGKTGVIGTIRQAADRLSTAEEEIGVTRIADGPAAGILRELEQATALAQGYHVVGQLGFGLELDLISLRERRVAAHTRARDA